MSSVKIRVLLGCGVLAGLVFFVGNMAFLGTWGSGYSYNEDRVFNLLARVPAWRLYVGAISGPVGIWLELLGMLGLWCCARQRGPRLAALMLVCLYTFEIFGIVPHSEYGPVGFALRFCGSDGDAVRHLMQLGKMLTVFAGVFSVVGFLIWIGLTWTHRTGVPRWTILFCPIISGWLRHVLVFVPAPIGFALVAGWVNLAFALFFAVVALTYRRVEKEPVR
jgi:hypothetical protein